MIDDQSVGARAKQLGQSHLRGRAVSADVIELIILRDLAAGRQRPDLRRYRLHFAPECHFSRQEFSARLAIRRSLVWEDHAHGHLMRAADVYDIDFLHLSNAPPTTWTRS